MPEISPSLAFSIFLSLCTLISGYAVLLHKDKQRDKELDEMKHARDLQIADLKKEYDRDIAEIKKTASEETERFKRTKGELYAMINKLNGELIGLNRDIAHTREGLSESNTRLTTSIADFKVEMVKSETRITQHMDNAIAVMKDNFRDAITAVTRQPIAFK